MYTIFKYQIPVQEKFTLNLPDGANIIRVEDVDGMFFMWAMVDTEKEPTKRYFECYKPGMPIVTEPSKLKFLGTCKLFIMQELCLYVFEVVDMTL